MESLSLETQVTDGEGAYALAFVCAGALLVGGIGFALASASWPPIGLAAVALLWYVRLFRTWPVARTVVYLVISEDGVTCMHAPGGEGRISRYGWTEMREAALLLPSRGDDMLALALRVDRGPLSAYPVLLPLHSEHDGRRAVAAIASRLASRPEASEK